MRAAAAVLLLCAACGAGLVDHGASPQQIGGVCQPPSIPCGDRCVAESATSCGTSCQRCSAPARATAICQEHACAYRCDAGFLRGADGCSSATSIAAHANTTCAIAGVPGVPGSVRCWGANERGQLGSGAQGLTQSAFPIEVPGTQNASEVAVGAGHACAIIGGEARCWGANDMGQLGSAPGAGSATPVNVPGISGAQHIAAGDWHTCAITASGVFCWGANNARQLGDGRPVSRTQGAISIAAGSSHTCVAVAAGSVWCWGANSSGQLGSGSTMPDYYESPVQAKGVSNASWVGAGAFHTCAVGGNTLYCWGAGGSGQLGKGNFDPNPDPSPQGIAQGASQVWGGSTFTCALFSGAVRCWGANDAGQLGIGSAGGAQSKPVDSLVSGATTLALGSDHSCSRLGDGSVTCWGSNGFGQAGDPTNHGALPLPTPIAGR